LRGRTGSPFPNEAIGGRSRTPVRRPRRCPHNPHVCRHRLRPQGKAAGFSHCPAALLMPSCPPSPHSSPAIRRLCCVYWGSKNIGLGKSPASLRRVYDCRVGPAVTPCVRNLATPVRQPGGCRPTAVLIGRQGRAVGFPPFPGGFAVNTLGAAARRPFCLGQCYR